MIRNKKQEKSNSIPIEFEDEKRQSEVVPASVDSAAGETPTPSLDGEGPSLGEHRTDSAVTGDATLSEAKEGEAAAPAEMDSSSQVATGDPAAIESGDGTGASESESSLEEEQAAAQQSNPLAGPMLAELLATRSELRRVETERNDLLERLARRQADFENYRKRVERERAETYQRMVGDVVSKLLPVMDNMRRALQAESLLEKNESAEFRHFLRGVELIYKQLNDALKELGVEAVASVGQPFDPHVHEAVATEHSDEYEPDTVTQELLRGYRLGEKLLRPAMVKVSTRQ